MPRRDSVHGAGLARQSTCLNITSSHRLPVEYSFCSLSSGGETKRKDFCFIQTRREERERERERKERSFHSFARRCPTPCCRGTRWLFLLQSTGELIGLFGERGSFAVVVRHSVSLRVVRRVLESFACLALLLWMGCCSLEFLDLPDVHLSVETSTGQKIFHRLGGGKKNCTLHGSAVSATLNVKFLAVVRGVETNVSIVQGHGQDLVADRQAIARRNAFQRDQRGTTGRARIPDVNETVVGRGNQTILTEKQRRIHGLGVSVEDLH